jgi:sugar O-acyltransferase (sialic acid O-acetyltransferase NeuD family)
MTRLVIYGAGGFGREVVTAARAVRREMAFLADEAGGDFDGIPILSFADLRPDDELVIAVADPDARRRLAARWGRFTQVAAPTAVIGRGVEIGEGAVICDFTIITTSARIGRHFHLNGYSYVAHDCVIGDFVTFGPGVQCNGNVHIGDGAVLGSGANIRNGSAARPLRIGEGAVVGMGAVVTRDVPAFATVIGNPAKPLLRVVDGETATTPA